MSETVLIVDDSLTVRMDLLGAFEAAGFRVLAAESLGEARQTLAREAVGVVVLDVMLPDGDGIELLKELRPGHGQSDVAVLMLSSEAEVKDRIRGLKTGADEYVGKPYDTGYLVARARELVRAHRAQPSTSPSILVVDDSLTFRDELRRALEAEGYVVHTAGSGEEGLGVAADRRPSAIVVDGVLPGIDGATVIRRIRLDAALRGVPCMLLTGSDGPGAELQALEAGADAFARKSEDVAVVLAKLAALLRRPEGLQPSVETSSLLGPKKILAVDDSMTYLQELAGSLRGEGYDVVLAHSGEEALELLAVEQVDCILLDLLMPGLGGQETCRRIKAAPGVRDIPLVMLTALEDQAAMIEGLASGADDYISKSGEFEILKARVRTQIRRKQFEDETRRIREKLLRNGLEAAEARAARDLAETRAQLAGELERKNKELEAFSYSVSHDLRAPLRSIDGFSLALLEDHGAQFDENGMKHLKRIRAAAQRMGELIDDLLALSRVGRAELSRQGVDLSSLVRAVAEELRRKEPGRAVALEVAPGLSTQADAKLTRILLENLLGNAWKFTSKTSQPRIEFVAEEQAEGTVYSVRDNGAGYNMAYAAKLFSPFQRLHNEAEFPGTGIGLATVSRIVDRHGGRVWAEGAVGKGAHIHFTLAPARKAGPR